MFRTLKNDLLHHKAKAKNAFLKSEDAQEHAQEELI